LLEPNIIVPAYNESKNTLKNCAITIWYLYPNFKYTWAIDDANNRRGKGKAIKQSLTPNTTNIYIDADLSVDPRNITPMLKILEQTQGIVIAQRIAKGRTFQRTLTSKLYNNLTRLLFRTGINDHQCRSSANSQSRWILL
jgi:hypothetical protein